MSLSKRDWILYAKQNELGSLRKNVSFPEQCSKMNGVYLKQGQELKGLA